MTLQTPISTLFPYTTLFRSYGRIVRDSEGDIERIVEAKTKGDATPEELEIREINSGIYVFDAARSEEHTSELQSLAYLVCRLLLEKKKQKKKKISTVNYENV